MGRRRSRRSKLGWAAKVMISEWIYGYSEGVSAAREKERLCEYDPAYQWLTGMKVINYHSLSDFRIEDKEELKELFIEVVGALSAEVLIAEGLITMKRVKQDGTKVEGQG